MEETIELMLKMRHPDLTQRTPYGLCIEIAKYLNIEPAWVKEVIYKARKKQRVSIQSKDTTKRNETNLILEACKEYGFNRASKKEGPLCFAAAKYLKDILPEGGHGILFGTPTPLCSSDHPKQNQMIIDDELLIAHMMKMVTENMTIVIGDAVNNKKAQDKVDLWSRLMTMSGSSIVQGPADRNSYSKYLTRSIEKYHICKVVLLTSGHWTDAAKNKYGLDLNFKSPSLFLTKVYSNLHILALTRNGVHRFELRYVHNGKENVIATS